MLERTAACLESGSLRRLLPASRKSLKSRRTLHSGFWSHGAGSTELSPLWTVLVRAADHLNQSGETYQSQNRSASIGGSFFDFLYPARTLKFMQQYSSWAADRQDIRHGRPGISKLGLRQYSSTSHDVSPLAEETWERESIAAGQQTNAKTFDVPQSRQLEHEKISLVFDILGVERLEDYEEAWRKYTLLGLVDQRQIRKPLMAYMSSSHRTLDASRTLQLFEGLDGEERDYMAYRYTVRSYLKLQNLTEAMRLYDTALVVIKQPAGSEELLAYLLREASWERAKSLWSDFQSLQERMPETKFDIYASLETVPNIGDLVIDLSTWVKLRGLSPSPDVESWRNFTSEIMIKVLSMKKGFSVSNFKTISAILRRWKRDTPEFYKQNIEMFLETNKPWMATRNYDLARRRHGQVYLSQEALHKLLHIMCLRYSIDGIHQVLNDFFRLYRQPSREAYKMCLGAFADHGDAETVHALFEQLMQRFSDPGSANPYHAFVPFDFEPLLHVHAKRGELSEVLKYFNQMEEKYNIKPNVRSWNILINAYGKVNDVDGAYECFEKLLKSGLHVDDYTLGTLMGICTLRGDLDRVLELYLLVKPLGIRRSTAMIDCLVQAFIQDGDIQKSEIICEEALEIELQGSRTRMWNLLIMAYAMRRDMTNVNRILKRMSEAGVQYDGYTYSAVMNALALLKSPSHAFKVLRHVMPAAGIRPTAFHYAIVMGGYLGIREPQNVFHVLDKMVKRGIMSTASTKLMTLKAIVRSEGIFMKKPRTDQQISQQAMEKFEEVMSSIDPQEIFLTPGTGFARLSVDLAYSTMIHSYIMFVLAMNSETESIEALYERSKNSLPEAHRDKPPLPILSALMMAKLQDGDHKAVEDFWGIALSKAKEQSGPVPFHITTDDSGMAVTKAVSSESVEARRSVLYIHQLALSKHLGIYLKSLFQQQKLNEMTAVVDSVIADGFLLDQCNWNNYITYLARGSRFELAFRLSESKLMDRWSGWPMLRWSLPVRNRLPILFRYARRDPRYNRAHHNTLLYLARAFLVIEAASADSPSAQQKFLELQRQCPQLMSAIRTLPTDNTEKERNVLSGVW